MTSTLRLPPSTVSNDSEPVADGSLPIVFCLQILGWRVLTYYPVQCTGNLFQPEIAQEPLPEWLAYADAKNLPKKYSKSRSMRARIDQVDQWGKTSLRLKLCGNPSLSLSNTGKKRNLQVKSNGKTDPHLIAI